MKRSLILLAALALLLPAQSALARGTPAGTTITNQAKVVYTIEATEIELDSNSVAIVVGELIDVELAWQDATNILVKPGETDRILTFLLTNTGNGTERFLLSVDSEIGGDQFDPVNPRIYLDVDGDGEFDPAVDLPYNPADPPTLAAGAALIVFVLNDIPSGVDDGDRGISALAAESATGTGAPGTAFPGQGDGGVNAVVGASGGASAAQGIYQVSRVELTAIKSATVADPFGGSEPLPGATITYTIVVEVTGTAPANDVRVSDDIPEHTTYQEGTLRLDGAPLTDAADGDAGEVLGSVVTVRLGDLQDVTRTVTFQVVID